MRASPQEEVVLQRGDWFETLLFEYLTTIVMFSKEKKKQWREEITSHWQPRVSWGNKIWILRDKIQVLVRWFPVSFCLYFFLVWTEISVVLSLHRNAFSKSTCRRTTWRKKKKKEKKEKKSNKEITYNLLLHVEKMWFLLRSQHPYLRDSNNNTFAIP